MFSGGHSTSSPKSHNQFPTRFPAAAARTGALRRAAGANERLLRNFQGAFVLDFRDKLGQNMSAGRLEFR
jgi:hypothetical protein